MGPMARRLSTSLVGKVVQGAVDQVGTLALKPWLASGSNVRSVVLHQRLPRSRSITSSSDPTSPGHRFRQSQSRYGSVTEPQDLRLNHNVTAGPVTEKDRGPNGGRRHKRLFQHRARVNNDVRCLSVHH